MPLESMEAADIVLITGASGFVGSAIARALAPTGCKLRVLVRATASRTNFRELPVEAVEGDIRDRAAVRRAMKGVRYVFHAAADYRLWAPDPTHIIDANVEGTRAVMEAALEAGVERVVYTSSVATLAPSSDGCAVDERSRVTACDVVGAYKRSKVMAERLVEQFVEDRRLPAVIVQPSTPLGPNDVKPTPTGRIVLEAARGRIPAFVDTGLNLVHVDDVANGHIAALHRGRIGERYILGGQDVAFRDMLCDIAAIIPRRPPLIRLKREILYPAAFAAEAMARVTGRAPLLTVDGLRMSKQVMYFSSAKAARELGYHARPYQDALRDAVAWFRQHDYIPPDRSSARGMSFFGGKNIL